MCMVKILEALCESFITRYIYYRSYPNNTRSISCALKLSQKQVKLSLNSGSISTTIFSCITQIALAMSAWQKTGNSSMAALRLDINHPTEIRLTFAVVE